MTRQCWIPLAWVFGLVHIVRKAVETVTRLAVCVMCKYFMRLNALIYQVVLDVIVDLDEIGFRLPVGAEDDNRLGLDFLGNLPSDVLEHRIHSMLLIVHYIWLLRGLALVFVERMPGLHYIHLRG